MPATDDFRKRRTELDSPYKKAVAVTPHATDELEKVTRAIHVGVAGHISMILADDTDPVLFKNLPAGVHRIRARAVRASGTTATDIVALY